MLVKHRVKALAVKFNQVITIWQLVFQKIDNFVA